MELFDGRSEADYFLCDDVYVKTIRRWIQCFDISLEGFRLCYCWCL